MYKLVNCFRRPLLGFILQPNLRFGWVLSVFLCCLGLATHAEVYKWTDKNGRTHYSDKPSREYQSKQLNIKINSIEAVSIDALSKGEDDGNLVRNERLVMYSTEWCGYCRQARNYFKHNKIAFSEYDIEKSKSARRRYDKAGGRGVPLIMMGKRRMSGFNPQSFEQFYR